MNCSRASDDNPVPVFLSRCIQYIEIEGLLTEGLYRCDDDDGDRDHDDHDYDPVLYSSTSDFLTFIPIIIQCNQFH